MKTPAGPDRVPLSLKQFYTQSLFLPPAAMRSESDLGLDIVGDVFAHRSACRPRSTLERLDERDESVPLERKDEVRERRALQPGRKERPLVVGRPVHDQRAARRKRERCTECGLLQSLGGDDRQCGQAIIGHLRHFFNRCRKRNIVLESEHSLREPLEERGIRSHQNNLGHLLV